MVGVGADQVAVRGDQLGRGDAVGGQPVAAGQPAQAAAEGVPGHAHGRGGARERGQAVPGGRDGHVRPHRAGLGAGGAGSRVDVHCPHACRPQQHRAVQWFERSGAVAGALRGDPDPVGAGEPDRPGHVGGRPGLHDNGGPLVHGQVPRLPRLVIASLPGDENLARDSRPQGVQIAAGHDIRDVHCLPSFLPSQRRLGDMGGTLPACGGLGGRSASAWPGCGAALPSRRGKVPERSDRGSRDDPSPAARGSGDGVPQVPVAVGTAGGRQVAGRAEQCHA